MSRESILDKIADDPIGGKHIGEGLIGAGFTGKDSATSSLAEIFDEDSNTQLSLYSRDISGMLISEPKIVGQGTIVDSEYFANRIGVTRPQLMKLVKAGVLNTFDVSKLSSTIGGKTRPPEFKSKNGPFFEEKEFRRFLDEEIILYPIERSEFFPNEKRKKNTEKFINPFQIFELLKLYDLVDRSELFSVYQSIPFPTVTAVDSILKRYHQIKRLENRPDKARSLERVQEVYDAFMSQIANIKMVIQHMHGVDIQDFSPSMLPHVLERTVIECKEQCTTDLLKEIIPFYALNETGILKYQVEIARESLEKIRKSKKKSDKSLCEKIRKLTMLCDGKSAAYVLLGEDKLFDFDTGENELFDFDNIEAEIGKYTDAKIKIDYTPLFYPGFENFFNVSWVDGAVKEVFGSKFYSISDVAEANSALLKCRVGKNSVLPLIHIGLLLDRFLENNKGQPEAGSEGPVSDEPDADSQTTVDEGPVSGDADGDLPEADSEVYYSREDALKLLGIGGEIERINYYITEGFKFVDKGLLYQFLQSEDIKCFTKQYKKPNNKLMYDFVGKYRPELKLEDLLDLKTTIDDINSFFNKAIIMPEAVKMVFDIRNLPEKYSRTYIGKIIEAEAKRYIDQYENYPDVSILDIFKPMSFDGEQRYSVSDVGFLKEMVFVKEHEQLMKKIRLGLLFDYYDEADEELPASEYLTYEQACKRLRVSAKGLDALIERYNDYFATADGSVVQVQKELEPKEKNNKIKSLTSRLKKFREDNYEDAEHNHIRKASFDAFISNFYFLDDMARVLTGVDCKWRALSKFYDFSEHQTAILMGKKGYHKSDIEAIKKSAGYGKLQVGMALKNMQNQKDYILGEQIYSHAEIADELGITEDDVSILIDNDKLLTVASYGLAGLIQLSTGVSKKLVERYISEFKSDNAFSKNYIAPVEGISVSGISKTRFDKFSKRGGVISSYAELQEELAGTSASSEAFYTFVINNIDVANLITLSDGERVYIPNLDSLENKVKHLNVKTFYEFIRENYRVGNEEKFLHDDIRISLKSNGNDWPVIIKTIDDYMKSYKTLTTPITEISQKILGSVTEFSRTLVERIINHSEMNQTTDMKVLGFQGEVGIYKYNSDLFTILTEAVKNDIKYDVRVPLASVFSEYRFTRKILEDIEIDINNVTVLDSETVNSLYKKMRGFQDFVVQKKQLQEAFPYATGLYEELKEDIGDSGYHVDMIDIDTGDEITGYSVREADFAIGSLIRVSDDDFFTFGPSKKHKDKVGYLREQGINAISIGRKAYTHANIAKQALQKARRTARDDDPLLSVKAYAFLLGMSLKSVQGEIMKMEEWEEGADSAYEITKSDLDTIDRRDDIMLKPLIPLKTEETLLESAMVDHSGTPRYREIR